MSVPGGLREHQTELPAAAMVMTAQHRLRAARLGPQG